MGLDALSDTSDFIGCWGDSCTLGITKGIRGLLGADGVNHCSGACKAGGIGGMLTPSPGKLIQAGRAARAGGGASRSAVPRKPTSQTRKEWEELNGQPWPRDPRTGRNMDADHDVPLADGGSDTAGNITPRTRREHIDRHKNNGDFATWGRRRNR